MKRLMVVDDEAVITTQLEDRLQSMKYDVVGTASSAEESVIMARELCPDLILMDIVMKGELDGIEAAEIIKNEMDVPVIFLTGHTSGNYIKRAKKVMPFGYIVKPFREDDIRANIEIAFYRKELERKQKLAEERIRRLFLAIEQNPYMITIMDVEGNIEFVNNEFCQVTSYTAEEIVGKNVLLLLSDEITSEVYQKMRDEIVSGREWRGELCIKKKDGTPCLQYTVALPVKDINDDVAFFVLVTEKIVKCEKRRGKLLPSERKNTLWTIVEGIAHEFNDILAVVHGNAEVLEGGGKDEKELKAGLHNIVKASDRGAGIVRNMVAIVKTDGGTSEYIFFDLKQLITQAIDSTMSGWKNIAHFSEVEYEIDKNGMKKTPRVFCDPTELREVFVNIITNALDAMPDGGRISFSTWSNEDTVFVKISDTGMGMSEEVKSKMFDLFFTTRRPARTGLGMGVASSIIARHGGTMEVESDERKGTTLALSLPVKNEIGQQKLSPRSIPEKMVKGLSILVVDDEVEICSILDKYFSRVGHMVKTVSNGAEAIELAKREDFDLVVCDLVMPDVTGHDVIKALNKLDKVPKIGISTGSVEDYSREEVNELKSDFIINKPYKLLELASKINILFADD
ncbi:MAG: response regulator [Candidatus Scalindua sp.]|nr:response regulator [Candidatus Scalindua sp.]